MHRRCLAPVHWLAISLVLMAAPLAGLNPAAIDARAIALLKLDKKVFNLLPSHGINTPSSSETCHGKVRCSPR